MSLTQRQRQTLDEALRKMLQEVGYSDFLDKGVSMGDLLAGGRPKTFWSPSEVGKAAATHSGVGNYTVGFRFLVTKASSIEGFKFYWPGTGNQIIRCSLWDVGSARMTMVDVQTSGAGEYTASFPAQSLTPFSQYFLSVWATDGSGTYYMSAPDQTTLFGAASPFGLPNGTLSNILAGENWILIDHMFSPGTGDAWPGSSDPLNIYGFIEPIFAI